MAQRQPRRQGGIFQLKGVHSDMFVWFEPLDAYHHTTQKKAVRRWPKNALFPLGVLPSHGSPHLSFQVPGLPQLARRFPAFMVKLVTNGTLKWRWYWVTEILEQDRMG